MLILHGKEGNYEDIYSGFDLFSNSLHPDNDKMSWDDHSGALVQSIERSASMREVTGSIPALATASSGQFVKFGVSVISVS